VLLVDGGGEGGESLTQVADEVVEDLDVVTKIEGDEADVVSCLGAGSGEVGARPIHDLAHLAVDE